MKSLSDPQHRVAIVERIKTVHPESRAVWGRMNAHQMLCHCTDAFRVAFGEKTVSPAPWPIPGRLLKLGALWFPVAWPKNVATRPEIDQAGGAGTNPTDFTLDRRKLIGSLDRFCRTDLELAGAVHPIFGSMSSADWKRWAWLHLDHHLRQFGC
ncbi:MAG: DUF1569 domain-containing protein [Bryobacteraceae bacterium]|nr:DUF1569 domain-containing protein [Bryobacteraceae bacterium]